MNRQEFDRFLREHTRRFPALTDWFSEHPDSADSWFADAFADLSLADCLEASRMVFNGEEERPTGWSDHPRVIRRVARQLAAWSAVPAAADESGRFRCPVCQDSGTVSVANPKILSRIRRGEDIPRSRITSAAVACTCEAGRRWAEPPAVRHGRKYQPLPLFDAERMFRMGWDLSESEHRDLLDWLREPRRQANYEPAFEAFR